MQIIFMQGISKQWPCLAQAPGVKNIYFHAKIISCTCTTIIIINFENKIFVSQCSKQCSNVNI